MIATIDWSQAFELGAGQAFVFGVKLLLVMAAYQFSIVAAEKSGVTFGMALKAIGAVLLVAVMAYGDGWVGDDDDSDPMFGGSSSSYDTGEPDTRTKTERAGNALSWAALFSIAIVAGFNKARPFSLRQLLGDDRAYRVERLGEITMCVFGWIVVAALIAGSVYAVYRGE